MLSLALTKLRLYWGIIVGVVLAVGYSFLRGRASGKESEQTKQVKRDYETIKKGKAVEHDVSSLPDSDVRDRLQKWTRD